MWLFNKERRLNKLRIQLASISAKSRKLKEICELTNAIWPSQKNMLIFYAGREASLREKITILEKEVDQKITKKMGVRI